MNVNEITLDMIDEALELIKKNLRDSREIVDILNRIAPYGFVHKRDLIKYDGIDGYLVWDYLIYNELTFEDRESKRKIKLLSGESDSYTEEYYNKILEKCRRE